MYTFLASLPSQATVAPKQKAWNPSFWNEVAARLAAALPGKIPPLHFERRWLADVGVGWLMVRPAEAELRPRLTEEVHKDVAAVVFGATATERQPAAEVLARYREGGLEAARNIEGSFSAVVVDRVKRECFVFCDSIGTRSLRFCEEEGAILVAPHDLALLAAGGAPLETDLTAAASVVLCGWSLGATPLLKHIHSIGPDSVLACRSEGYSLRRDSFLDTTRAVDANDAREITRVTEQLEAALIGTLRQNLQVEAVDPVRTALTAGVDSRAVLALLLATHPQRIIASTVGEPQSLDVKWARRICEALEIQHENSTEALPVACHFAANNELLAFVTNGDTNAKHALSREMSTASGAASLGGTAGEIFRGYYYPYLRRSPAVLRSPSATSLARLLMWNAFPSVARVQLHKSLVSEVEGRLAERLRGYERYTTNPYGYLDCFYLRERYGVWGSLSSRKVWSHSIAPFHCGEAVRLAARLPPPWGDRRIQAELIRRHLPLLLYWLPINGSELLALHGSGAARFWLRDSTRIGLKLVRRALPKPARSQSPDDVRARLFAGPIYDELRASLLTPGGLPLQLMSKSALEQALDSHRSSRNNLQPLGYLASLQTWYGQVHSVRSKPLPPAVDVTELG